MSSQRFRRTISSIYDAALVPDLWPAALQSVMDEVGAVGAHYGVFNKRTESAEWLSQSGPLGELEADYLRYLPALGRPRPNDRAVPGWKLFPISEFLPETVLRR